MKWVVTYHKDVEKDLRSVGPLAAKRILKAIDNKLTKSPMEFGYPLTGNLSPLRKLRVGDYRVVYQVTNHKVTIYVLAVGPRRDKEIYTMANKRT
ncbi:MAG: type II toxin-antitoxin system RelE/ParE family toxin [Desulfuromusa sp.]|nr:type II toxin-antitoxin system RelE/ParE family toxin [Desulfuromusa sp.]